MTNVITKFKALQLEIHSLLSIGQTGRTYLVKCNTLTTYGNNSVRPRYRYEHLKENSSGY